MDKYKLVRIIAKDLEELKTLNEEIEATEEGSLPIVDLALSRAKLLCQELELLKSFSTPPISLKDEIEEDEIEEEENELTQQEFPEPELEILHFEEQDFSDSDDLTEEENEEEQFVYDSEDEEIEDEMEEEKEEEEESEVEDLPDFGEPLKDEVLEDVEDEIEEDEIAPIEEHELDVENEDEEINEVDDEEDMEVKQEKPTVRQIEMEELDDEEEDSVEFSPVSSPTSRPAMREIPKPEVIAPEINFPEEKEELKKKETEPTFQKDRSLNDAIGEKKEVETNLTSPITSLRAAIGLNDRFLFIREIFNNNSEKYNTIIDQLDKMETIQQAVDYLKVNLSLQKNETSMKFVDLLKRRFTK
jgi:hypothetical protein